MRRTIVGVIAALLLPASAALVVSTTTVTGCKDESDGCGKCYTKLANGQCGRCDISVKTVDELMDRPECCGCSANIYHNWAPSLSQVLEEVCDNEEWSTGKDNFICRYRIETMSCDPWQDTGGDTLGPYGDETPWTESAWSGEGEGEASTAGGDTTDGTTGVDPTTGDVDTCPGHQSYDCSGWCVGVYRNMTSGSYSWGNGLPFDHQQCYGWPGDDSPNQGGFDVIRNLDVCAGEGESAASIRAKCKATAESTVKSANGWANGHGIHYVWDHAYCDFTGDETAVPANKGGGNVGCYSTEELHAANVVVGGECTESECEAAEGACTNWNNTSHVDSPEYNIGYTADTTCTGSPCYYDNHKIRVDDDFWLAVRGPKLGLLTLCDGPYYDWANGDMDGTFATGDLLKVAGFASTDYDLEIGATSSGPWYDVQTEWMDAYNALGADNEIYVKWKRTCITCSPHYYTLHRAKVTISECGVNSCPNP